MITIVITTYGDDQWRELAWSQAYPSAALQADSSAIVVHHEPEMTIGPARNAAAALAPTATEYLLFLDADDELAPNYLDQMRRAIGAQDRNPIIPDPILYQPACSYVHNGRPRRAQVRPAKDLRHDNYLVIGTVLPRWLFREVGGFEDYPHGFEDWSLWAKCWKAGAKVVPVPTAIYYAYVNPASKHRTGWRDRKWQVEMHLKVQRELFPEGV